jgi:hypothetical protein
MRSDKFGQMKTGDIVRVVKIPVGLSDDSQKIFELCLGKCFPIEGIENGHIELLVGQVVGVADYLHSIYLESEEFELVEKPG